MGPRLLPQREANSLVQTGLPAHLFKAEVESLFLFFFNATKEMIQNEWCFAPRAMVLTLRWQVISTLWENLESSE